MDKIKDLDVYHNNIGLFNKDVYVDRDAIDKDMNLHTYTYLDFSTKHYRLFVQTAYFGADSSDSSFRTMLHINKNLEQIHWTIFSKLKIEHLYMKLSEKYPEYDVTTGSVGLTDFIAVEIFSAIKSIIEDEEKVDLIIDEIHSGIEAFKAIREGK